MLLCGTRLCHDATTQLTFAVARLQVCVVQFSNDTRVEFPLGPLDKEAFDTALKGMVGVVGLGVVCCGVASCL